VNLEPSDIISFLSVPNEVKELRVESTIAFVIAIGATILVCWLRKQSDTMLKAAAVLFCLVSGKYS